MLALRTSPTVLAVLLASCVSDDTASREGTHSSGTTSGTATTASTDTTASTSSATSTTTGTSSLDTTSGSETTASSADESSTGEPPGQRVLLAVGYGGMRVRSLDDGQSWQDYGQLASNGGDDMDLLRGAAWGGGRFVAAGWRIFSSEDAVQWTEHDNPTGQWLGAVAYGNGMFLGVGGGGYCARSSDGTQWETCTDATDDNGFTHVRSTLFHDGSFWTADANGVLRSSPDGDIWTFEKAIGSPWVGVVDSEVVVLAESTPAELEDMRLRGGSTIARAEAGSEAFVTVFDVPNGNNVFQAFRFAFTDGWIGR
jgi:hypothetical protein